MSVNTVGSSSTAIAQQALQSSQAETREVGPDHDGDADDTSTKAVATPATTQASTVNTLGQVVGTTISTKA